MDGSPEAIQYTLKCSFCRVNFKDVVKFIPDCGSLICGDCHAGLASCDDQSNKFKCYFCNKEHILPADGFAEVKPIMEMLKLRPKKKAADNETDKIKRQLESLREIIRRLGSFDSHEEITKYFNHLELEVIEACESSIIQTNKSRDALLKEIREHKQQLFEERTKAALDETQRPKTIATKDSDTKRELEELSKKVNELDLFLRKTENATEIQNAMNNAQYFEKKLKQLSNSLTNDVFKDRFLRLKHSQESYENANQLGKLVYETTINGNLIKGIPI